MLLPWQAEDPHTAVNGRPWLICDPHRSSILLKTQCISTDCCHSPTSTTKYIHTDHSCMYLCVHRKHKCAATTHVGIRASMCMNILLCVQTGITTTQHTAEKLQVYAKPHKQAQIPSHIVHLRILHARCSHRPT